MTARCIIPGCVCEGPDRPDWPMPLSPLAFFGPDTWLDDDELDRAAVGRRQSASEFTVTEVGDLLGVSRKTVLGLAYEGRLFPSRYEETGHCGSSRAVYGADRVAGELMRRRATA